MYFIIITLRWIQQSWKQKNSRRMLLYIVAFYIALQSLSVFIPQVKLHAETKREAFILPFSWLESFSTASVYLKGTEQSLCQIMKLCRNEIPGHVSNISQQNRNFYQPKVVSSEMRQKIKTFSYNKRKLDTKFLHREI